MTVVGKWIVRRYTNRSVFLFQDRNGNGVENRIKNVNVKHREELLLKFIEFILHLLMKYSYYYQSKHVLTFEFTLFYPTSIQLPIHPSIHPSIHFTLRIRHKHVLTHYYFINTFSLVLYQRRCRCRRQRRSRPRTYGVNV